jgi:hypothetical protein
MPMRSMLFAALAFSAAAAAMPAAAAVQSFPVGGFNRVVNATPFDVRVHTGGAVSVRANGPDKVLERLDIVVRDGRLMIGTQRGSWFSGWNWRKEGQTVIDVTVPALQGVALAGPGNLSVDRARADHFVANLSGPGDISIGALQAGSLDLNLSGPGNLTLAGRAQTARLRLSGPGSIRAAKLAVRDADISVSGPGDVALTASGTVGGSLAGPGDIVITGGARCQIRKSGPGDVRCR